MTTIGVSYLLGVMGALICITAYYLAVSKLWSPYGERYNFSNFFGGLLMLGSVPASHDVQSGLLAIAYVSVSVFMLYRIRRRQGCFNVLRKLTLFKFLDALKPK